MKFRRRNRLGATLLAVAMMPAVTATAVLVSPAQAQAAVRTAKCRVHEVLARKDVEGGLPANLEFLRDELSSDQFAAYKSFQLLGAKDFDLVLDTPKANKFKSGHKVVLKLLGGEIERPRVQVVVEVPGKEKPSVSADYTIHSSGFLLLAGLNHTDGKLIFAIQCEAKP